jgi:hypothetical protein
LIATLIQAGKLDEATQAAVAGMPSQISLVYTSAQDFSQSWNVGDPPGDYPIYAYYRGLKAHQGDRDAVRQIDAFLAALGAAAPDLGNCGTLSETEEPQCELAIFTELSKAAAQAGMRLMMPMITAQLDYLRGRIEQNNLNAEEAADQAASAAANQQLIDSITQGIQAARGY